LTDAIQCLKVYSVIEKETVTATEKRYNMKKSIQSTITYARKIFVFNGIKNID